MATNQYGVTLKETLENRYNMPFKDAMQMLAGKGLTRTELAKELGYSHSTVTKYSLLLGVDFQDINSFGGKKIIQDNLRYEEFKQQLKNKQLTSINALSKKWSNFSI